MDNDVWELYNLNDDFSQGNDLAKENPAKLEQMKKDFMAMAKDNKDFPIGAGLWLRIHPEDVRKPPYTEWTFTQSTQRMPEFDAPGLGKQSNLVTIDMEVGNKANGVLYAVGGAGGGLTLYMENGILKYEYNMELIENYTTQSQSPISAGKHKLTIKTEIEGPAKPGVVTLSVDGKEVASCKLVRTVPAAFTATETFDVGKDLGSPVSYHYYDKKPFTFTGTINSVHVKMQ
mgnify:FL=1